MLLTLPLACSRCPLGDSVAFAETLRFLLLRRWEEDAGFKLFHFNRESQKMDVHPASGIELGFGARTHKYSRNSASTTARLKLESAEPQEWRSILINDGDGV